MPFTSLLGPEAVKAKDSTSPDPFTMVQDPATPPMQVPAVVEQIDPEAFLKRCSGYNKKTKSRCSVAIGKKSQQNTHPAFLPTCAYHRDQQQHAGWCQFRSEDGGRCGRLFRWTPPYLELCYEHTGDPSMPCYFFKLPLELRQGIFRYILPTKPIGSSTAMMHAEDCARVYRETCFLSGQGRRSNASAFPMPLLDLYLVNRQIYQEVKSFLFSITTFNIDIQKHGTFVCGRRLLEPRRADGSPHFTPDEADAAKAKFLKTFPWAAVKNYCVDILLENWSTQQSLHQPEVWDEEVEIYDIRDYVSVVVSGILAKSKSLCKLQVRVCLAEFQWSEQQVFSNTELIISPFERLRNVRQPQVSGIYMGRPPHNIMVSMPSGDPHRANAPFEAHAICSVPILPTETPLWTHGTPGFDYVSRWSSRVSSSGSTAVTKKAPIRIMFTEFKDFYCKLCAHVPGIDKKTGREAYLHRARVAREQENVKAFRLLRNELIQLWYFHLELEDRKRSDLQSRLSRMLDVDTYPSHERIDDDDDAIKIRRESRGGSPTSPIVLDDDTTSRKGISMAGNMMYPPMGTNCGYLVSPRMNSGGFWPGGSCIPGANAHGTTPQQRMLRSQQLHAQAQAQAQAQVQARMQAQMQMRQAQQARQYCTLRPSWIMPHPSDHPDAQKHIVQHIVQQKLLYETSVKSKNFDSQSANKEFSLSSAATKGDEERSPIQGIPIQHLQDQPQAQEASSFPEALSFEPSGQPQTASPAMDRFPRFTLEQPAVKQPIPGCDETKSPPVLFHGTKSREEDLRFKTHLHNQQEVTLLRQRIRDELLKHKGQAQENGADALIAPHNTAHIGLAYLKERPRQSSGDQGDDGKGTMPQGRANGACKLAEASHKRPMSQGDDSAQAGPSSKKLKAHVTCNPSAMYRPSPRAPPPQKHAQRPDEDERKRSGQSGQGVDGASRGADHDKGKGKSRMEAVEVETDLHVRMQPISDWAQTESER